MLQQPEGARIREDARRAAVGTNPGDPAWEAYNGAEQAADKAADDAGLAYDTPEWFDCFATNYRILCDTLHVRSDRPRQ